MAETATPETEAPSDEAMLATPFVQQLVKQMRAQDTHGQWEGKSDLKILKPFILTAEERRAAPEASEPQSMSGTGEGLAPLRNAVLRLRRRRASRVSSRPEPVRVPP